MFGRASNPGMRDISISQETFNRLMLLAEVEDKTFDEIISGFIRGKTITL